MNGLEKNTESGSHKRVVLIVLDSLGIGALTDAYEYGDAGADTFGHIVEAMPNLSIPNLRSLGFCNIDGLGELDLAAEETQGSFGRMNEASTGKDTITGNWEIAGLLTKTPFKTYEKFPAEFMARFEEAIGIETLGNYAASGTEIIEELGSEHERTGKPIIYTSADSVFQIAANTAVIPLKRLYEICEIARKMLVGDVAVGRVIARPYIIKDGKRVRTSHRKDYSVAPPSETVLDNIKDSGREVVAIGKISDIFAGHGITESIHTDSNADGIDKTIEVIRREWNHDGLIFTNLVDFDSKYGHRRDAVGYGKAIEEFDKRLPEIINYLNHEDILMICADHGNDPKHSGWDHTREYVPVLAFGSSVKAGVNLGTRDTFADLGATIAEHLAVDCTDLGTSFFDLIVEKVI
jgi:phosphopentomutase